MEINNTKTENDSNKELQIISRDSSKMAKVKESARKAGWVALGIAGGAGLMLLGATIVGLPLALPLASALAFTIQDKVKSKKIPLPTSSGGSIDNLTISKLKIDNRNP